MKQIGLAEAITALRRELAECAAASVDEEIQFRVGPVNVELEVIAEHSSQASGGLKFWVVGADMHHTRMEARTHRVTVELTPITAQGSLYTADDLIPH